MLPATLFTLTVAFWLPVTVMFWTLIVAGSGARTVTDAAPLTVVFAVEVAVMVVAPGATAVTTPAAVTVATDGVLEVHVTVRATPASASTLATKPCVSPGFRIALAGETVTFRTAGAVTVIVTVAFLLTSAVAVAVMLAVPAATAVTRPVPSTDATFAALEVHVTASLADNWTLAPTETAVTGAPEIVSGGGGGSVMETSSPQAASPARLPTAINDRNNFCILSPFWSVNSCTYNEKTAGNLPGVRGVRRPGTATCYRQKYRSQRTQCGRCLNDKRPHHELARHFSPPAQPGGHNPTNTRLGK